MSLQKCDYLRIRTAVAKLLDFKYGDSRIQRVRDAMNRLPKRGRAFIGAIEPLNELITLAELDFQLAQRIVDLTVTARVKLKEEVNVAAPQAANMRKVAAENVKRYRRRLDLIRKARELEIGHKLLPDEAKAYLANKRAEWNKQCEKFRFDHPELNRQQASAAFACVIDREAEQAFAKAQKAIEDAKEKAKRREELRKPSDHVLRNRR